MRWKIPFKGGLPVNDVDQVPWRCSYSRLPKALASHLRFYARGLIASWELVDTIGWKASYEGHSPLCSLVVCNYSFYSADVLLTLSCLCTPFIVYFLAGFCNSLWMLHFGTRSSNTAASFLRCRMVWKIAYITMCAQLFVNFWCILAWRILALFGWNTPCPDEDKSSCLNVF